MSDNGRIKFTVSETNEELTLNVVEETRINNINYLLVTEDTDEEEETAYILKDLSADTDKEADYVIVDNDEELEAVSKIFGQLLEDAEFIIEE